MGLTGDFAALKKLRRDLADLARPGGKGQTAIGKAVGLEGRKVLQQEFASGEGVAGEWAEKRHGGQALKTKKIPSTITADPTGTGVLFRSVIDWLEAHQEGHTFPPRRASGQLMIFRKGRLVSAARAAKGWVGPKSWRDVISKAHAIGQRVLPARPFFPIDALPPAWVEAVRRGATAVLERLGA
jgi:hypothetical protein